MSQILEDKLGQLSVGCGSAAVKTRASDRTPPNHTAPVGKRGATDDRNECVGGGITE